jgi:hypothetical protein
LSQRQQQTRRRTAFLADTVALILFFTATGIINERMISGMTWEQVFHARLLGALLMVPLARPYGIWRDGVMKRAGESQVSKLLYDE